MMSAIKNLESSVNIDMIICHAPGTINGDAAELNAINNLFGGNPPLILSNKWKIGHTLGASGLFSLEYALIILNGLDYVDIPYTSVLKNSRKPVKTIMINAAGFGGGAVSLIVSK